MASIQELTSKRLEPVIRPFKSQDTIAISELISRCLREVNSRDYSKSEIDRILAKFTPETTAKMFAQTQTYVAACGERLVGTATLFQSEIRSVFVDPDIHGQGIGRRLMEFLEKLARTNGVKEISLNSSLTSRDFYTRLGYRERGEVYREVGGRMIIMVKEL